MRRWLSDSASAAAHVADRPGLWLPGALAWTVSVGWLVLVIGVAKPPSVAELTFLGADLYTSGAWPWNVVAIGALGLVLVLIAFGLASAAEATLLRGPRTLPADAAHILELGLICVTPALIGTLALAPAIITVAPGEFNAPDGDGGPLLRTALRLAPFWAAILAGMIAGAAVHAAAARRALAGASVASALLGGPLLLARAGLPAVLQTVALLASRVAYAVLCAVLLRVLWGPIGARLDEAGIDPAVALLLVGFVAIWLCLVLGGGALHAWGSVSWSRVLGARLTDVDESHEPMERRTGP